MSFKIKYKLLKDGLVTGIICDINGVVKNVKKTKFKELFAKEHCTNACLTEDCKIRGSSDNIITLNITKDSPLLFHGSKKGIVGKIKPASRVTCDFGQGFYTGTYPQQAKGLILRYNTGVFYNLFCNTDGLNIYRFKDTLEWALYVGVNRNYIDIDEIPKFKPTFNKINNADIIVGVIADDKMQEVFPQFIEDLISDKILSECLKLVKLGDQWVFKTQRACDKITVLSSQTLTQPERRVELERQNNLLSNMEQKISGIKKLYRTEGEVLSKIKERFQ